MLNPIEMEKFVERTRMMIDKAKKMQGNTFNEKFFVVELKERKPMRTIQQNAYLWVTITYVALEEGYPKAKNGAERARCAKPQDSPAPASGQLFVRR